MSVDYEDGDFTRVDEEDEIRSESAPAPRHVRRIYPSDDEVRRSDRDNEADNKNDDDDDHVFARFEISDGEGEEDKEYREKRLSARVLYIHGLNRQCTERDLVARFTRHGRVLACHIPMNPGTRTPKNYGFIRMSTATEASAALEAEHGKSFMGVEVVVERAKRSRPGEVEERPLHAARDNREYHQHRLDRPDRSDNGFRGRPAPRHHQREYSPDRSMMPSRRGPPPPYDEGARRGPPLPPVDYEYNRRYNERSYPAPPSLPPHAPSHAPHYPPPAPPMNRYDYEAPGRRPYPPAHVRPPTTPYDYDYDRPPYPSHPHSGRYYPPGPPPPGYYPPGPPPHHAARPAYDRFERPTAPPPSGGRYPAMGSGRRDNSPPPSRRY